MLLAVDTSTRAMGIALYNGLEIVSQESWMTKHHHTVELAQAVENNLSRVGSSTDDLKAVGVALGPGSFTGLRIGMAFVKGIVFHHQIPLCGVPSLDVVAASQQPRDGKLAAVLEAGRNRYAVGWYEMQDDRWISTGELENLTVEELLQRMTGPTLVAGELTANARESLEEASQVQLASPISSLRSPAFLAQLAWQKWQEGERDDPSTLSPIYLHRDQPIPE